MSSTTSWRSAAAIVCSSRRSSAQIFATPNGWLDEVLAGAARLALVRARREVERARQQIAVDARVVGLDVREQLVDEVLVSLSMSTTAMTFSVLGGLAAKSPRNRR